MALNTSFADHDAPLRGVVYTKKLDKRLRNGDTYLTHLDNRIRYASRMVVTLKKCALAKGGRLHILINGEEHRYIDVKRVLGERSYSVPVERYVEFIEFTNDLDRGCLKLKKVSLIRGRRLNQIPGVGNWNVVVNDSEAYMEVNNIKLQIDTLFHQVGPQQRANYLDPLTVTLGQTLAILESTPTLSQDASNAVLALVTQIESMEAFFDELMRTYSTEITAREVKSSARRLKRMLTAL